MSWSVGTQCDLENDSIYDLYSSVIIMFTYLCIFESNQAHMNGIWEQETKAIKKRSGHGAWQLGILDILNGQGCHPWDT